jgi:hypothetical protein
LARNLWELGQEYLAFAADLRRARAASRRMH